MLCKVMLDRDGVDAHPPSLIFRYALLSMSIITGVQAGVALAVDIGGKWALLGRREPGAYSWDKSSYCQVHALCCI